MFTDLRYVFRSLAKSPGFTSATILILALGIGGVTAMFSTLYAVMLQPLPYPEPAQLVLGRATYSGEINGIASGPDYLDYRDQSQSFASFDAFYGSMFEASVTGQREAQRANCLLVSPSLFSSLGVNLELGRPFARTDGEASSPAVVIVSHSFWQKQLDADPGAIGRSLVIGGAPTTIIGVAPASFRFIHDAEVWLPQRPQNLGPRRFNNWLMLGRLKPGVTLAEAQSEVDVISARLERAYPDTNTHKALLLTPLQSAFTEQYRPTFGLLCGGAAAVLLIACTNAAGLLLARATGRYGELAVRAALGASNWRVMRLLLVEALALAGLGGLVGLWGAVWLQAALLHWFEIEAVLQHQVGLSWPVLLFAIGLSLVVGLAFGLLPAWRARRPDLVHDLKAGGRANTRSGSRLRAGLVVTQVALSFMLLVVVGLLTRSLDSLQKSDPGFNARNLLTVEVPLPLRDYPEPKRTAFFAELLENIRALPGVTSAAAISQLPLRNPWNNVAIRAADAADGSPASDPTGNQRVVLPGYFETMGIRLLAGRDIGTGDTRGSGRVVVISEILARQLFGDRGPVGRLVVIDGAEQTPWEVVGVVADVKSDYLRQDRGERGSFYRPHAQQALPTMRFAIRTAGAPQALVPSLRALLAKMDSRVPLSGPRTMEQVMANTAQPEKVQSATLGLFSALALVLAAVGLYGLLAYTVAQRRRDIGIRLALGATAQRIVRNILQQAGWLVLVGTALGAGGAIAVAQVIRAGLFGISPVDPVAFLGSGGLLLAVAALAAWLPARRAAQVNPVEALRAE